MKDGVEPGAGRDLSCLRSVGSTGPHSPEGFEWVYDHVGRDTWLFSTSGGTDLCTRSSAGYDPAGLQGRATGLIARREGRGRRRGRQLRDR